MGYRSYMGGVCLHCGLSLGLIEVDGGRLRRYCNDACRKAASRKRLKRDEAVSRNEALVSLWEEHGIAGSLRQKLENILVKRGKDAARDATEAVIAAIKEVDGRYMSRSAYDPGKRAELDRLRQSYADLMYKHAQLRTAKERLERALSQLQPKEPSAI
jgi:hypothetical protein